ncbi:phage head closure protein [uncultured Tyzzerella sp.]|uniref:phage head closure protein n=1 Tax=uncultured Tyzzerella sp. TaxID=2321398 RepID=UPI002942D48E|nr:phage head closure protein [uncultured Tyzzerella sp.]
MLPNILDKKIEVYKNQKSINDLGQTEYKYCLYKKVWANIIPTSTKTSDYIAETDRAEYTFKFILRENSVKELTRDMYFIYKNQRYDIDYFIPNFKNKDRIEVICKLVVE